MGKEKEKEPVSTPVTAAAPAPVSPKYSKGSLLRCAKFAHRRDALRVLLKDNESYTMEQAEKLLNDFMNERMK